MKSKEELNALKEEVETVSRKLHELTEDELEQVVGGESKWGTTCSGVTPYICNNPQCDYYGCYVSVNAGPVAPGGGSYLVCGFCGEIITLGGFPVHTKTCD